MIMINCNFTKDELIALSAAIKIAANSDIKMCMDKYNADLYHHYPEGVAKQMSITDESDMTHYLIELRGNIKSLIRNNENMRICQ